MENTGKTRIVILAAGKGTRMKSELPKALVSLHGKHMIRHLLESVDDAKIDEKPILVVGYEKELVIRELGNKYEYVVQENQLGTGHAVLAAKEACGRAEYIIAISADQPFLKSDTIKNLWAKQLESKAVMTISTSILPDFENWRRAFLAYGRIIRTGERIFDKEIKDCTPEELKIREVNVSLYAFKAEWLWDSLSTLNPKSNAQGEYQLTDVWQTAQDASEKIESIQIDPKEALGANSKEELEILEKLAVD